MKSFPLNTSEASAVLRWVPHLEADRKEVFGSRPDATMTLTYYDEDTRMIALAQLSIAVLNLKLLSDHPKAPPLPRVLSDDMRMLGRVVFRLNGLSDEQIDAIDKEAEALALKFMTGQAADPGKAH